MLPSQVHENLYVFIHSWLLYIQMQKVEKSGKLECTLDVLCHLYQTQMLLAASEFAALLLFLYFSVELIFIYKVVFILFKCIFKFTFMFQQT